MNKESEFFFGPHYERGLFDANGRLTRFCKGNSSTQSNPNQSTNIDDSRTAGSEGSIVLGSGSSGSVQVTNVTTDAGVIASAGDAVAAIAQASSDANAAAVAEVSGAASDAAYSAAESSRASSQASSDAAYSAAQASASAANSAAQSSSDSSYSSSQSAQAAVAAAERAAYEAGQVALKSSQAAAAAASSAAYESARASAAASQAAMQSASNALNANVDVSRAALSSNERTAQAALYANADALTQAFEFGQNAQDSVSQAAKAVIDFRSEDTKAALLLAETSQKQAADLLRYGYENFTSKLASNAGDAPQETVQNIVKYVATMAVAGAALVGAIWAFKSSKSA